MVRSSSSYHQKRVRHLWDEARESRSAQWRSWLKVFLYEIQPFRVAAVVDKSKNLSSILYHVFHQYIKPFIIKSPFVVYRFISNRNRGQYLFLLGLYGYWKIVVFVHNWLEAGPFFIILTLLILIFTIGLGDNDSRDQHMSAYSVFNRGMQSILGAIDADQLVAQHVGGGGGLIIGAAAAQDPPEPRRQNLINIRRPRQEVQLQALGDENDLNQGDRPAPRRSNKKQRNNRKNRNAEMRQEMQRQREAARAMGFGQEGEEADWMAIHRLVEREIEDEED